MAMAMLPTQILTAEKRERMKNNPKIIIISLFLSVLYSQIDRAHTAANDARIVICVERMRQCTQQHHRQQQHQQQRQPMPADIQRQRKESEPDLHVHAILF